MPVLKKRYSFSLEMLKACATVRRPVSYFFQNPATASVVRKKLESSLQAGLIERAKAAGWHAYKVVSPGNAGFPDVCIVAPMAGRSALVSFCELKVPGEEPTPIQAYTLRTMRKSGVYAFWADNIDDAISFIFQEMERLRTKKR